MAVISGSRGVLVVGGTTGDDVNYQLIYVCRNGAGVARLRSGCDQRVPGCAGGGGRYRGRH